MLIKSKILPLFALAASVLLPQAGIVLAEPPGPLEISSIERLPDNRVRIIFFDAGSGATGYRVDSSPLVGPAPVWTTEATAAVTPLVGTASEAVLAADGDIRFFRIVGAGGTGGEAAVVGFDSSSITIDESQGTVNIPLTFSSPFQGTLFYTFGGSTSSADISPLSGSLQVNGLTAAIVVELLDNLDLNELRYLTLDLSAGSGYVIGGSNQASVIIRDDDTIWSGNFQEDGNPVGFSLKLLKEAAGHSGALVSDGGGVFPEGEFPAQVEMTETTFSASVNSVTLPAESNMFGVAAELALTLSAADGVDGQSVEDSQIEGVATLEITFPSQPQLNTTLSGPFLMIRQAIRPSTRQVELSSN